MSVRSCFVLQALACGRRRFYAGTSDHLYERFRFPVISPLVPMGIVKIGHWGALSKNRDQQSSRPSIISGVVQEERLLVRRDLEDDLDSSDLAEVGCELAMVGDQTCSVPYDLYDLSDLKYILSLETWNYCLTEEERFHLVAYLPDMDQETFFLAMKELLSGDNLFFGNPLEKLFHRLQAGFYSLHVTPVREGLRFLQKQGHYHSVRLYHESKTKRFMDMGKAWSSCLSNTTVEERVRIWNKKKDQKFVLLVDLNAIPADDESLNKADKKGDDFPLLKKTKYMDEGLMPHIPAIDLNSVAMNTKPKGKGVLKVRAMETNSTTKRRLEMLPSDPWEPSKRVPKGVLKIKPRCNLFGQPERPTTIPIPPGHSSASLLGIHASKFSPPVSASNWHEETDSDEDTRRSLVQPEPSSDQQIQEVLNMGVGSFNDSHSFPRKIKAAPSNSRFCNASELQEEIFPLKSIQRPRIQSDEPGGIGGCRNGGNLWLNSSQQSRVLCASSSNSDSFTSQNQQKLTRVHHTVTGEIARISTTGTPTRYLDHKDQIDGGLISTTPDSTVVSGVEREIIFPITYKRKKACTKFNPVESNKQPSMAANLESIVANNAECNLGGKTKTIKIKVKGRNKQTAQV